MVDYCELQAPLLGIAEDISPTVKGEGNRRPEGELLSFQPNRPNQAISPNVEGPNPVAGADNCIFAYQAIMVGSDGVGISEVQGAYDAAPMYIIRVYKFYNVEN